MNEGNSQGKAQRAPGRCEQAIVRLLAHLPELWGDQVKGGRITLTVDADAIEEAQEAARLEAQGVTYTLTERMLAGWELPPPSRSNAPSNEALTADAGRYEIDLMGRRVPGWFADFMRRTRVHDSRGIVQVPTDALNTFLDHVHALLGNVPPVDPLTAPIPTPRDPQ